MIEIGQWWTNKKVSFESIKITKINYKINCLSFNWGGVECVSNISGFCMRYYYNAKMTNDEIVREIIK